MSLQVLLALIPLTACNHPSALEAAAPTITTLTITSEPLHTQVQRFGINLSGQTFYDSGQMLRNFAYRNPGFEGETWQSILHCKSVAANTCTDENSYTVWPANFLSGAHYEILSGPSRGATGTIQSSTAANNTNTGVTLTLSSTAPTLNDFLLIRIDKPGDAQTGWWTEQKNGATLSTELHDLSPHSPGKQALRIEASNPGATASVKAFFDSYAPRSFLQLRGRYTIAFRAKALAPNNSVPQLTLSVTRLDSIHGNHTFLTRTVPLTPTWRDYTFDFTAAEDGRALGTIQLAFDFAHTSALLDDATLTEAAAPDNPTVFRNAVVQTLRDLHPGVLRYMDNGPSFGSSLANLLAPPLARLRSGSSTQLALQEDQPIGIPDFLTLCQAIHADPWLTLPPGASPDEARALIAYLAPWQPQFHTIHLELGNEQWNNRSFSGATLHDPKAYAQRAAQIFAAFRAAPGFDPARIDLILGSFAAVPWWTQTELAAIPNAQSEPNTVSVAPYLFNEFNDASTTEAIFGPMFAQPEQLDSRPAGVMAQQLAAARAAHTSLAVYETNLSTVSGSVTQSDLDLAVPSLGAGITVADHMLLMLRDLGITTQCLFSLPEYLNGFSTPPHKDVPLWGAVLDMGGPTNLRRPSFLALQLINAALLSTELKTTLAGPSPTWNQSLSSNDKIQLDNAHELQTFAFADGSHRSLILLNLSRTQTIPLHFAEPQSPAGPVEEARLTSAQLTDSNEHHSTVVPTHTRLTFNPSIPYNLPPHSLTTLTWTATH